MPASIRSVLRIDMPIIVRMGEKAMRAKEVTALQPGSIIELPKNSEDPLELMVNNKVIGTGNAVKVGENFGLRIEFIGDLKTRIEAMGDDHEESEFHLDASVDADALAEQLLAEQGFG